MFSYFEDDLDKVLTLFVPLLRRWYEDDNFAFKVCTSVPLAQSAFILTMLCCFNKRVRLLFGCRILLWLRFMLSGLLVLMERARLSQNSTRARGTELQPLGQTRCMIFPPITSILLFNNLTTLCLLPVLLFQSITTVLRIFG